MAKRQSSSPQSVEFDCLNCKKTNSYPSSAVSGDVRDGATSIVKKCIFCGTDNTVTLPEGFVFQRDSAIFRDEQ